MATPLPATSMPCLSLLVPEVSLLTTIPVDSFGYHNLRGVMRPLVMILIHILLPRALW